MHIMHIIFFLNEFVGFRARQKMVIWYTSEYEKKKTLLNNSVVLMHNIGS